MCLLLDTGNAFIECETSPASFYEPIKEQGLFLPIFGSSILDSGHYNQFISQCGLICPLGYETDIEGNPMCKCNDPCMYEYTIQIHINSLVLY
ncbi:hypothetical protein KUTeg_013887 [Tegillarca granosa]|uniref:Antistasin-like domain-containing protein n=1 Tax=Tegillarca granosa TaxID=220873 RepID=A0ABQ9F0E6_TEGGR|nr:hypothetical protein KUTeg_013887 [Tegillarca granosa]